ncbi:MAG: hypothetical protein AYL28_003700 [Candidatus Bathyarchaeota archaeon B23]|nr:MAG: hypothetical protein AYL28_003700 [Candidatus Bathyarchaeota archaeon B23]
MGVERTTLYFDEPGQQHTDETLRAARRRAEELGIRDIVVASTRGETGVKAVEVFDGYNVVVVTHATGFREPGAQELSEEVAERIRGGGGKVLTATHVFAGAARAIRRKFETATPVEVIAQTLRLFGQGTKVCVEIVAMAADAGLIPVDRDVIAIAGTGRGADTALVIKPAHASRLFEMAVREIIAKPRG